MEKRDRTLSESNIWEIRRELSYRIYKRLPDNIKEILDNSGLTPRRKYLASLLYKRGINIKKAIRLSHHHKLDDRLYFPEKNLKYVILEFKHQGFIPISKYKRFNPRYPHITTNFLIDGEYWVYPKRFGSTYKHLRMGYPLIENEFPEYGLQGYTRLLYGTD